MLQVLNEMMMANTSTSNCGLQPPPSLISTPSLYVSSPSGKWTFDLAFICYISESSSSIFPQKHLGHSLLPRKQWKVKVRSPSHVWLFVTPRTVAYQAPPSMGFSPGKSAGVDCHFLLQEIFPTQESNPGLPHCRQMLYRLSHQRSPKQV